MHRRHSLKVFPFLRKKTMGIFGSGNTGARMKPLLQERFP
jgi:hypothetical protein